MAYRLHLLVALVSLLPPLFAWYYFFWKTSSEKSLNLPSLSSQSQISCDKHVNDPDASQKRANAVIFILCRNSDLNELLETLWEFEETFNKRYGYPYVLLNDKQFSDHFIKTVTSFLHGRNVSFGCVPKEHWSYPDWIDQERALKAREKMAADPQIEYGGKESYHFMCRFYSGFFYRHPLVQQYDYFWRVEPGARYFCCLNYDPFVYMMDNKLKYGFSQVLSERFNKVPTLWETSRKYIKDVYPNSKPADLLPTSALALILDDVADFRSPNTNDTVNILLLQEYLGQGFDYEKLERFIWNTCHYWSNFEIGDFRFFRSSAYQSYFDYLDRTGGFFYERWGDAPVHTLAVGLFLSIKEVHHFSNIGYQHWEFTWCPLEEHKAGQCYCERESDKNLARPVYGTWCLHKLMNRLKVMV